MPDPRVQEQEDVANIQFAEVNLLSTYDQSRALDEAMETAPNPVRLPTGMFAHQFDLPSDLEYKDLSRTYYNVTGVANQRSRRDLPIVSQQAVQRQVQQPQQHQTRSPSQTRDAHISKSREVDLPSDLDYKDQGRDLVDLTPRLPVLTQELPSTIDYKDQRLAIDEILPDTYGANQQRAPQRRAEKPVTLR